MEGSTEQPAVLELGWRAVINSSSAQCFTVCAKTVVKAAAVAGTAAAVAGTAAATAT
jgi:hypothetical protein